MRGARNGGARAFERGDARALRGREGARTHIGFSASAGFFALLILAGGRARTRYRPLMHAEIAALYVLILCTLYALCCEQRMGWSSSSRGMPGYSEVLNGWAGPPPPGAQRPSSCDSCLPARGFGV